MSRPMSQKGAVFFDRDGVLNEDTGYLHRAEDFRWVPGARRALRMVQDAGLLSIIVTNQSGVARGYYTEDDVALLHAWVHDELSREGTALTAVYTCPYHNEGVVEDYVVEDHPDRKPNPGMLLRAMAEWNIDPHRSLIVGDKPSDVEAGRRAGILGLLFTGGDLAEFLAPHVQRLNRRHDLSRHIL
jgi:D-glycero-D-manno-heptose 1,7-bisphosphate phosphatase